MNHNEYERRRQQLDEELQAGIQLLESAHRLQVGALDLVWRTWSGEGVAQPAAAMKPSAPAGPVMRGLTEIRTDLPGVLERLPRVFDRRDVCRALGYEPKRSSLYKALLELVAEGVLTLEASGGGQVPSRYRKP